MRGLGALLMISLVSGAAGAAEPSLLAVYWQPPGVVPRGAPTAQAFRAEMAARRAVGLDATEAAPVTPSLAGALEAAVGEYRAFHFAQAVTRLTELSGLVDAQGGDDLDAQQLSEIHLYRGLARLELGQDDAAWDDFVRAARLDPTRALDPAQFPPRAIAAYQRAVAGAAALPRALFEVRAPAGATVRVDGQAAAGPISVTLGEHYVRVEAEGFRPWAGVVPVSGARQSIAPPLQPWSPPDGDRLVALGRARGASRVVLGALTRSGGGWRFVGRVIELPGGRTTGAEAPLDERPTARVVGDVVAQLFAPPLVAAPVLPPSPAHHRRVRWWVWALVGGAAAALAVALPIGIVYSGGTPSGSVGGAVGPLR